jgi:flagellar basal-body rod modification protein FlgD
MTTTGLSALGNSTLSNELGSSGGTFGDNPFLRLLTEQLRNQTPLEPVDNESFMNQMASYSSMQQQSELNQNMLALLDFQGLLARMQGLSQGSALLGKEISYEDPTGGTVTGVVESVYVAEDGEVRLRLAGGNDISLREVTSIANPAPAPGGSNEPSDPPSNENSNDPNAS